MASLVVDLSDFIFDFRRNDAEDLLTEDAVLLPHLCGTNESALEHPSHRALADLKIFLGLFRRVDRLFLNFHFSSFSHELDMASYSIEVSGSQQYSPIFTDNHFSEAIETLPEKETMWKSHKFTNLAGGKSS